MVSYQFTCLLQVNEEYLRHLEILSKKLKFVGIDYMLNASEVFQDVQEEMDRLRQTAVAKVFAKYFLTKLLVHR